MYTYTTTEHPNSSTKMLGIFKSDFEGVFEASKLNAKLDGSSHEKDDEGGWRGGDWLAESYDNTLSLETNGYNAEAINETLGEMNQYFAGEATKIDMDYAGDTFDVGSLVSGELKHWFATKYEGVRPQIHLVVMGNGNAGVSSKNWLNQAAAVAKVAESMSESADIRISAGYFSRSSQDKGSQEMDTIKLVEVKGYGEHIDFRRLGAVSHPSFFRRIVFGLLENSNGDFGGKEWNTAWGYGRSVDTAEELDLTNEHLAEILGDEKFVLTPNAASFRTMESAVEIAKSIIKSAESKIEEMVGA